MKLIFNDPQVLKTNKKTEHYFFIKHKYKYIMEYMKKKYTPTYQTKQYKIIHLKH